MDASELRTGRTTILYQIARWQAESQTPRVSLRGVRIVFVLFLELVIIAFCALVLALFLFWPAEFFLAPIIGTPTIFFRVRHAIRALGNDRDEGDAKLLQKGLDRPAPVRQEFARIALLADGRRYGSDVGIVSAVDGWISFEGRKTRFSLPWTMLRRTLRRGKAARGLHPYDDELVIEVGGQSRIVRLTPLMTRKASTLGELIDRSMRFPPPSRGLAVLPPFIAPSGPRRPTVAHLFAGVAIGVGLAVIALVGIEAPEWVFCCVLIAGLVAVVTAYATTRRKGYKLRDPVGVWEAEAGLEESALVQRLANYGKWSFDQPGAVHDDAI